MLTGARIVSEAGDEVTLDVDASMRSAAKAHLSELKPFFAQAMGRRDVSLKLVEQVSQRDGGEQERESTGPTTSLDQEIDHPLVRQVAELFDATPRSVQPRPGGL